MRVISGLYKGRKLVDFKASHIRPTTDRVKESIFNVLQFHLESAVVLDLFAGTGNLGIEALSRGAKFVTAVEKHKKSCEIIYQNLKLLKVDPASYRLVRKDVISYLKNENLSLYDIILIDPPFTESLSAEVMGILSQKKDINCRVMIESSSQEELQVQYGALHIEKVLNFGDKFVSFFNKRD